MTPGGAVLEGRAIGLTWPASGGGLEFEVADPGQYRLELSLAPDVQSRDGITTFDLRIPRLATSRLELATPGDAPAIEVPLAAGSVTREAEPPRVVAQLGPADRLRIRWPEGAERSTGNPAIDVEELLWLKIKPGAAVLETLLKFKVVRGHARQIRLAVDPHLQLLPSTSDGSWVGSMETAAGPLRRLTFQPAHPFTDSFSLRADFLMTDSIGVGNLRLPYLETIDVRTERRWLAVSVDPEMQFDQHAAEPLAAVAVPVFLAAWGAAATQPRFVYRLTSPDPAWSLSVQPSPAHTTAEQTLTLGFAPGKIQVFLDARLTTWTGRCFQYRIRAPKELEVEQISVLDDGSERFSRWARGPEDTINVFLNGQASERQNLTLRGRLPVSPGDTPLPVICVAADETKAFAVQLYRDSAVQLEVTRMSGLAAVQSSGMDEARASLGHPIKELRALPSSLRSLLPGGKPKGDKAPSVVLRGKDVEGVESISANLRLKPNRPKIRGEQITSLRSVDGAWETEADFRLTVSGGIVDELWLDAPAEWPGPYKIQPPAVLRTVDVGKGRKQLIVRPQTPIEKEYRLRVWGPLAFAAGDRPSVPHVRVEQAEIGQHLVVVPVQSPSEPLAWEIRGLIRAPLPDDYSAPPGEGGARAAYRVVREPFQAALTPKAGSPACLKYFLPMSLWLGRRMEFFMGGPPLTWNQPGWPSAPSIYRRRSG